MFNTWYYTSEKIHSIDRSNLLFFKIHNLQIFINFISMNKIISIFAILSVFVLFSVTAQDDPGTKKKFCVINCYHFQYVCLFECNEISFANDFIFWKHLIIFNLFGIWKSFFVFGFSICMVIFVLISWPFFLKKLSISKIFLQIPIGFSLSFYNLINLSIISFF